MLAGAHAEENGSHKPSPRACRFLNARIVPFAHCRRFRAYRLSIYRVTLKSLGARGEGFNRRVSILVIRTNAPDLICHGAPKLTAGADGIESERYDFDKISLVTFFLGKKVTSFVKN
jgi:hypothetical protein